MQINNYYCLFYSEGNFTHAECIDFPGFRFSYPRMKKSTEVVQEASEALNKHAKSLKELPAPTKDAEKINNWVKEKGIKQKELKIKDNQGKEDPSIPIVDRVIFIEVKIN